MTVYVVVDPLIAKDDSWETHLASLLQGYIEAKGDEDCKVVEIVDIADIKALFESKSISNEDNHSSGFFSHVPGSITEPYGKTK